MVSGSRISLVAGLIIFLPLFVSPAPQEAKVNRRKIEKEQAKKKKQANKEYEQAVKRHNKMQSRATRASMKKTKKESKKFTPTMK